jgi:hypothetical protein
MCPLPRHFPDCFDIGARSANAAACLPLRWHFRQDRTGCYLGDVPLAGSTCLHVREGGMLVSISARAMRSLSAAMMSSVASVTCVTSRSICFKPRLIRWESKLCVEVASRAFVAVRSLINASLAVHCPAGEWNIY